MEYTQLLTSKEAKAFTQTSTLKGLWLVLFNWGLIVVAFLLPILWLNPLTIIISLILIANRQLGLSVLMHECAHYSLFRSRRLNQWVGKVFCAAPVLINLDGYRRYHMKHHRDAGTDVDPDYPNYQPYPVSKSSFRRKVIRDLSGVTGFKNLYALLLMYAGLLTYDMSYQSSSAERKLPWSAIVKNLLKNFCLPILTNIAIWAVLYLSGYGWLYLLWWVSYFTLYMLFVRIRNAAEHASTPNLLDKDPRLHARTTYASWWERLTFAPNYVNYHLEHHLRPSVPCYNLKAFHQFLLQEGMLEGVRVSKGYRDVVGQLIV